MGHGPSLPLNLKPYSRAYVASPPRPPYLHHYLLPLICCQPAYLHHYLLPLFWPSFSAACRSSFFLCVYVWRGWGGGQEQVSTSGCDSQGHFSVLPCLTLRPPSVSLLWRAPLPHPPPALCFAVVACSLASPSARPLLRCCGMLPCLTLHPPSVALLWHAPLPHPPPTLCFAVVACSLASPSARPLLRCCGMLPCLTLHPPSVALLWHAATTRFHRHSGSSGSGRPGQLQGPTPTVPCHVQCGRGHRLD